MSTAADQPTVDRASLAIARGLDIQLGAYTADATLMVALLDALVRPGWKPMLSWDPVRCEWHAGLTEIGGPRFHRVDAPTVTQALVFAAVNALDVDLWRMPAP